MIGAGWRDRAACADRATRHMDPWFPSDYRPSGGAISVDAARAVCATCPVTVECLSDIMAAERGFALVHRHGVFAGATPEQRHAIDPAAQVVAASPVRLRPGYIDATGTARRLQGAAVNGWSVPYIAMVSGVAVDTVMVLRRRHTRQVQVSTANAIARACADLTRRRAPDSVGARATANRARVSGWVPAHAWHDIDDPDEQRPDHKRTA